MEDCNQVNIPTTDDTALECTEFNKAKCTIVEKGQPYLGIPDGTDLETYLCKVIDKLKNQQSQINQLKVRVNELESQINN